MRFSCSLLSMMLFISLVLPNQALRACTIFMANDGSEVWIGNNEDELQNKQYRIWYYPARKKEYGYMIWTELSMGKLLNGLSYLNPQGGLNEYGLFMDFTAIDKIPVTEDPAKRNRKKEVVTDLLKNCKTVTEALEFLSKYNLVKISTAQLFIADASGEYAVVTGGYIVRKTSPSFALTNYCINNGQRIACHRREVATQELAAASSFHLEEIRNILEKSSQKLPNNLITNYSMAINLKTSTLHLYYKNDFSTPVILSLKEELKKGRHHREMATYFPQSISPVVEELTRKYGIEKALIEYKMLRNSGDPHYNFNNADLLHAAIGWIDANQSVNAEALLKCLIEYSPSNADLYAWLGVSLRKRGDSAESEQQFAKALALNPAHYVAVLFGQQQHQQLSFCLPDFEGAEKVAVMGAFTNWTQAPIPLKKENGCWVGQLTLPKGAVLYKFIVNDQYLADSKNYMHVGKGPDIFSKVYVW